MPIIIPGTRLADTGYKIDQSIRFNATDTPKLTRTPSSTGNRDKWTFSAWVKRGKITDPSGGGGESQVLFTAGNDVNNWTRLAFQTTGGLNTNEVADCFHFIVQEGGTNTYPAIISTNRLFRDVSAWYHVVAVYDSGNSIASERIKIYFNGVRETNFSNTTYPSQNVDSRVNHASTVNRVGAFDLGTNKGHFDGYMAEIQLLDGYAYDPSYFGETNDNGIWVPKEYTGSYGTNGFHIDGRDSADLGDDESGNGNDFASSGLATHDQMADSPTNNHAIMNTLDTHTTPNWTASNGNLDVSWNGANYTNHLFSTLSMPSTGKWYFEIKWVSDSNQVLYYTQLRLGIMSEDINAAYMQANTGVSQTGSGGPEFLVIPGTGSSSSFQGDGANLTSFFSSFSMGDVLNFARDGTKLWVGKNGTYYNSGDPANGTNATSSALELKGYRANMHWTQTSSSHGTAVVHAFFGADKSIGSGTGFNNTVPSGFLALNTANLGS